MRPEPEQTLCSLLERWSRRGERTAVVAFHNGREDIWSYGRIAAAAREFGFGLMADGAARLEPVVICARNSPEWVAAFFGTLRAGALPVPVSDLASKRELAHIVTASGARRIVTTRRHAPDFREVAAGLRLLLLDDEGAESWKRLFGASERPLSAVGADDPASLLWTSGTTGVPKGVPLTHRNFVTNLGAVLSENIASAEDRILLPLPLHHAYPFTVGLLVAFGAGSTLLIPAGMTGPEITAAIRSGGATAIVGVPRLYASLFDAISAGVKARGSAATFFFDSLLGISTAARRILRLKLGGLFFSRVRAAVAPKLHILVVGGARLDPELGARLQGLGYEVLSGYGLTETAPILTLTPPGRFRAGAEGIAAPGVEIEIVPEAGQTYGEILVRGPNVFTGYWKNDTATRAAFTADGWFRTGDLGFLDADGYLHITGRKSEMIVVAGGENVFPEEVEAIYAGSPAIREVAILEDAGKLVALVVPDEAAMRARGAARFEATLRDDLENLSTGLSTFQRISGFAVTLEPLPRTHQIGRAHV